ncbi:MAG: histidinol-phosphate aminotransferase family protein [bacterium]|nr:histidinol-phosphate aminotransferase family protein [bacterium]
MRKRAQLDPARMVREELRQLSAYHLDRTPCRFKLDQNEMPFDLPRPVKQRVVESLADRCWGAYPDFNSDRLRAVIGDWQGWPAEGVLLGNGSGELLALTVEAVTRAGDEVLGTLPSFSLYKLLVLRAGAVPRFLAPRPDLAMPTEELEREIERDPERPLILCSPNNPTGEAVTPEALERLLERLEAPLLLDNAYDEFCRHDYRPLLARHRHLAIFRTLSKAWAMAAWRLGYLLADPDLVTELIKVKLPYNLGFASARAAEAALASSTAVDRRVRAVIGRRAQWTRMLASAGFEVFPSEANFLMVRHARAEELRRGLEERSIRVRDVSYYPGLAGCFRIAIGSGAALRATRQAVAGILNEAR